MVNENFGGFCCRVDKESVLLKLRATLLPNRMPMLRGNMSFSSGHFDPLR
jgi:hypothetical protein